MALNILPLTLAAIFIFNLSIAWQAEANIYSWTDSNGVKHFSNSPPSDKNKAIEVQQGISYDRNADEARWELDKEQWEAIKQNLEKKEAQTIKEINSRDNTSESPNLTQKIKDEKFRLEVEISRLEKKPAGSFAHQRDGKRAAIAFYKARLKELQTNPARYFDIK